MIQDPFSSASVYKLMTKFFETGSLHDKPRSGRPCLSDDAISSVQEAITAAEGKTSVRRVSSDTGVKKSSVHHIVRSCLHLWPYKISLHQQLEAADKEKRLMFADWLERNEDKLPNILWSDESIFSLNGTIHRHNCRIWSETNPHASQSRPLHSPQIVVWMGFTSQFGLRPFFFDGTVNSNNYLAMLKDHVIPQLKQRRAFSRTIFMQDGAPPHFATIVRQFLKDQFRDRLISRGCDVPWPPRSPDLSPLDYWFWAWLKSKVFTLQSPLRSIDDLKQRIVEVCESVTAEEFSSAVSNILIRLACLREVGGGTFE